MVTGKDVVLGLMPNGMITGSLNIEAVVVHEGATKGCAQRDENCSDDREDEDAHRCKGTRVITNESPSNVCSREERRADHDPGMSVHRSSRLVSRLS